MYNKEIRVSEFLDELGNANCRFVCGPYFVYFNADDKFAYTNINNSNVNEEGKIITPSLTDLTHIDYKGRIVFRMEKGNELPKVLSIYNREDKMILTMTTTGMMSWITRNR